LIQESKASGADRIDCGRADLDNEGLIRFKDRLGAKKTLLTYYRYAKTKGRRAEAFWESRDLRQLFTFLPDAVSSAVGRALYGHMG
jgi:hypothetical protein